jgi:hypothetical protein
MSRCQFLFYATSSDLSPLLSSLEMQRELQYTLTGLFETDTLKTYLSYANIPDFGRPDHPTAVANQSYLMAIQGTVMRSQLVPQRAGGVRFSVDQRLNADTVVFWPGGLYGNDVLLYGQAGTVSDTITSKNLYGLIAKLFRERFQQVEEYLVGPEALDLCKAGVRLALSVSTPPKFDLKPQFDLDL